MKQEQFLSVVSADEARRRWDEAIARHGRVTRRVERVALREALGRVLAEDVAAPYDVPSFDRSNLDGFAVRAVDTFGAEDEAPKRLSLSGESLVPGQTPHIEVTSGRATPLATGAVIPRGADAVVPVEHTDLSTDATPLVLVRRPAVPGAGIASAGGDVARGETVLRAGTTLTSRETGTLAACGLADVAVVERPRVAILSTGGELIAPGTTPSWGQVFDSNATILADAVRELGGEPVPLEIAPDDAVPLRAAIARGLAGVDLLLISGGTSKGGGDLVPDAIASLDAPGLVVHGVDLKPGKPLGLAVSRGVPVAMLPGFPTSAIFTFHEFVAPVLRRLVGDAGPAVGTMLARVPRRMAMERGRTEYLLVSLVEGEPGPCGERHVAYPMGKGSGSVTAFARADGFIRLPGSLEFLDEGEVVTVTLLGRDVRPADLIVIGSHCIGLDALLAYLAHGGLASKVIFVGSTAGRDAAARGECDIAPIHLLDATTGLYNTPFVPQNARLLRGYTRRQGICFRPSDLRFEKRSVSDAVAAALADPTCRVANRNRGSGTRALLDGLLRGARPPGFASESRSHFGVAAAVAQGRADWGVCLDGVAKAAGLATTFVATERYDFVVPNARAHRPAVVAFERALASDGVRARLRALGFDPS